MTQTIEVSPEIDHEFKVWTQLVDPVIELIIPSQWIRHWMDLSDVATRDPLEVGHCGCAPEGGLSLTPSCSPSALWPQ